MQQRIIESLNSQFSLQPIIFWHDPEGEYSMVIDHAPNQRWLIYSAKPEPEPTKDWLLDVRMRSKSFRADSTSILLEDLGLSTQGLRQHLKERAKFLRAKDRVDRLKRLVLPGDDAQDLDRKMPACARYPTPFARNDGVGVFR